MGFFFEKELASLMSLRLPFYNEQVLEPDSPSLTTHGLLLVFRETGPFVCKLTAP